MVANVKIVDGKYRLEGEFHTIEPNQPIRNESGALCGVTNPRRVVHLHSYGGEAAFFEALSKGKLLATRCDNPDCTDGHGSIFAPYRLYCPDCLARCTEVDLTNIAAETATAHSFMITERTGAFNTLGRPIRFVNVEFAGVPTILMGYLAAGRDPEIGMRVRPVFQTEAPTFTILDLAWVPDGTPAKDLPKGFHFGG